MHVNIVNSSMVYTAHRVDVLVERILQQLGHHLVLEAVAAHPVLQQLHLVLQYLVFKCLNRWRCWSLTSYNSNSNWIKR